MIGKERSQNIAEILGKILYEVPKVNMIINLANTFITVVKKIEVIITI